MLEEISSEQLAEWRAIYRMNPWDIVPAMLAQLCAIVVNALRSADAPAASAASFLPDLRISEPDASLAEEASRRSSQLITELRSRR